MAGSFVAMSAVIKFERVGLLTPSINLKLEDVVEASFLFFPIPFLLV
jgi:hypothetical protein